MHMQQIQIRHKQQIESIHEKFTYIYKDLYFLAAISRIFARPEAMGSKAAVRVI